MDFYNECYKHVSIVNPVTVEDRFDENTITLNAQCALADFGTLSSDGESITYCIWSLSLRAAVLEKIDLKRKTPLALPYPLERFEEIRVKVPLIDSFFKPTHQEVRNEYVEYSSDSLIEDNNTYRLIYSLRWLKDHIPVEDLSKLQPLEEIFDHLGITVTASLPDFETKRKGDGLKWFWRGLFIFFAITSFVKMLFQITKFR